MGEGSFPGLFPFILAPSRSSRLLSIAFSVSLLLICNHISNSWPAFIVRNEDVIDMASFFPDLCAQFSTWPVGFMCPLAFFQERSHVSSLERDTCIFGNICWFLLFFLDIFTFNVGHFQRPYWICCNSATVFLILATRDLSPQPGLEPVPPALERELSTTGAPGKFPWLILLHISLSHFFFSAQNISYVPCCVRA